MESIIQNEKKCFITGSHIYLEKHHVIPGTANRKKADRYGLWVWLNADMHRYIHGSKGSDMLKDLKRVGQREFEKIYDRDLWMKTFHHNYLEDE